MRPAAEARGVAARTLVTPMNKLETCEIAVWIDAACLPDVNHLSTLTVLPSAETLRSMGKWERSSSSEPRGPLTETFRHLTDTVTPSGTASVSDLRIVFCQAEHTQHEAQRGLATERRRRMHVRREPRADGNSEAGWLRAGWPRGSGQAGGIRACAGACESEAAERRGAPCCHGAEDGAKGTSPPWAFLYVLPKATDPPTAREEANRFFTPLRGCALSPPHHPHSPHPGPYLFFTSTLHHSCRPLKDQRHVVGSLGRVGGERRDDLPRAGGSTVR